ncbi:MAG: D-aminoacyl-tRNA deacylase [Parachlamydiaceae bacterium]
MRILVQRVKEARVRVNDKIIGAINKGILALVGIHKADTLEQIQWGVNKLTSLRLFNDHQGKMNLSIKDVQGELLVVSQFTLYGNCQNGRRPDFMESAPSSIALPLYTHFIESISKEIPVVQSGQFGADMQVELVNDGPVTLMIEN